MNKNKNNNEDIYFKSPLEIYENRDGFSKDLLEDAQFTLNNIEEELYTAPAFIYYLKAHIPEKHLEAVFTKEQDEKIAKGALELFSRKNGKILGELRNPKTKKIIEKINLEEVDLTPNLDQARVLYMMQMQIAQISEDIKNIAEAIEQVRQGQQDDRIAIANSCKQKLIQAKHIKNDSLREKLYVQIISDAENSRNQLMLNQLTSLKDIQAIPKSGLQKFISGTNTKEIDEKLDNLMDGLNAINMVSLVEILAYYELGEKEAAIASFEYFSNFIENAYFASPGLVERLDNLDRSTNKIWKNQIYRINKNILELNQRETLSIGDNHEEN